MIALATAACVFVVGVLVLPPIEPPQPPAPATPAPPPAPPPPPVADAAPTTDARSDATTDATSDATAGATSDTTPKAKSVARPDAGPAPKADDKVDKKPEPKPAAPATAAPVEAPGSRDKSPDKEVARDAWRKNVPDVTLDASKAALLIPIKGSIEGATYHVTAKPRSVLVTLPKAESMITMPFYNVRHDGFRQLWIKKDEQTGVTNLRIVLGESGEPQVEIKDDFVRVTVRRLTETPAAPAPAAAEPGATPPTPAAAPSKPASDGG